MAVGPSSPLRTGWLVGRITVSIGGAVVGVSGRIAICVGSGVGVLQEIKRRENKNVSPRREVMFLRMGRIVLLTLCFVNYADSSS